MQRYAKLHYGSRAPGPPATGDRVGCSGAPPLILAKTQPNLVRLQALS